MAAWETLDTLPNDGRRVLFTRAEEGDPVQGPDLVQVFGWMGVDGKVVIEQVLAGEPGEGWQPTHWWPDPAYDQPPS
jgi:hypothetical protein